MNKGIIVASFGTTYKETRELCIESIENRIKDEFPDFLVKRAFTSRMVIEKLKKRDNYHVDTPTKSLTRMKEEGVKDIYILPLLIIEGFEYEKILREARDFMKENLDCNIFIGKPLLSSERDYERVVEGLNLLNKDQAIVFMGHGTEHKAVASYDRLEKVINEKGYNDVFLATVEGKKTIEDIVEKIKGKNIKRVLLKPFMLVAGDHATKDMASDSDDSWKRILEKNGIEVTTEIKGLGQLEAIQNIFIEHLRNSLE